jgi:SNF2 family DNA or RNA helicase
MANFTASLEYLRDQLVKRGINVGLIYGDDSGANYRGKVIDGFNADRIQVIVSQVAVAKVGLNLSHSDTLIFAENSYSGEARIQAEERCTVRGKEAVEIVDFYATSPECDDPIGMIDLSIRSAVINKKDFNASSLLK